MTYAVVWAEDDGAPRTGRLDLAPECVRLGGPRGLEISYADVLAARIDRRPEVRLAGRPTLVIEIRSGGRFRVASLNGAGALHELSERLLLARRPPE